MQRKWNLIIVPNSPGQNIYSFHISLRSIAAAVAVAGVVFVLAIASLTYAGFSWHRHRAARISHLQKVIETREAELAQLNREFTVLEELEDKLRTIAGLKPRERSEMGSIVGGQGGPDWETTFQESQTLESQKANDEPWLQYSVDELLDGSLDLKDSFSQVLDIFEREKARLQSVPSICPVASQEAWISSGFGYRKDPITGERRFHEGCDIVAPRGTPVIAPADGIVSFAGWRDGMGRLVEIEHGYGYSTGYAHNSKLLVRKGDIVKRGDVMAHVGSSGRSTGPHLHYEVRLDGKLVNPYQYLVE